MITSEKLTNFIQNDISKNQKNIDWEYSGISKCLIQPQLRKYIWAGDNTKISDLWLVFDQSKKDQTGYKIVYSEEYNTFGLAVSGKEHDIVIGLYGSFIETLKAM